MNKIQLVIECKSHENSENQIMSLGTIIHNLPMINSYVVEVSDVDIDRLQNMDFIKTFHYNTKVQAQMNISRKVVKADVVQNVGYSGKNVNVAVLDTGISSVKDFISPKNRIIAFKDVVNNRTDCYDDNGHGTHVRYQKS